MPDIVVTLNPMEKTKLEMLKSSVIIINTHGDSGDGRDTLISMKVICGFQIHLKQLKAYLVQWALMIIQGY
jgi:hypothetical protein